MDTEQSTSHCRLCPRYRSLEERLKLFRDRDPKGGKDDTAKDEAAVEQPPREHVKGEEHEEEEPARASGRGSGAAHDDRRKKRKKTIEEMLEQDPSAKLFTFTGAPRPRVIA